MAAPAGMARNSVATPHRWWRSVFAGCLSASRSAAGSAKVVGCLASRVVGFHLAVLLVHLGEEPFGIRQAANFIVQLFYRV